MAVTVWESSDVRIAFATALPGGEDVEGSVAVRKTDGLITLRFKRTENGTWPPDDQSTLIVNLDRVETFYLRVLADGSMLATNAKELHFRCETDGRDPADWSPL